MKSHPEHAHGRRHRLGVYLHRWHRRGGLFAAVFLLWLAISGLALNEQSLLNLDQHRIDWPWLMRTYGLDAQTPAAYTSGAHWLLAGEGQTLLDGKPLAMPISGAIGMVQLNDVLYVATPASIILLRAADGLRIDELRMPTLPATPIHRLGLAAQHLVIEADRRYASGDGESWQATADASVHWSQARPLNAEQLRSAGLRPSLPLSRVLADLHSGQIFGGWGKRFVDLVGLAAILLALTGLWAALRRRHRSH